MVLDIKFNTSLSKPKSANTTVSLLLAVLERFWFRDFFYSRDSIFLRFFFRGILFVASFLRDFFFRLFSSLPAQRRSQLQKIVATLW